jgi:hypothetical protein
MKKVCGTLNAIGLDTRTEADAVENSYKLLVIHNKDFDTSVPGWSLEMSHELIIIPLKIKGSPCSRSITEVLSL